MDHPKITDTMYYAMAMAVCGVQWRQAATFRGVARVHITNRFSAQGYVLENPEATCAKIADLPGGEAKIFMMGNTHMHSRDDF